MAGAKEKNPKTITIFGRLSFPSWTAQAAYELSQKGDYKAKSVAEAKPSFQLLVEQGQLDKLRNHIIDVFFPYCLEQHNADEKRDKLDAKEIKELTAQIKKADFEGHLNTPFKALTEKNSELAPECVATVKVLGNEGQDMELKAIVREDGELAVDDGEVRTYPVILPISDTVHQMYPGCYVAATLNLYAYHNGKLAGFSAGASTAVFKADGDRFGGGVAVDEDEIFLDD